MVMKGEGAYEHLDNRYRRYAALPDDERIAWIKADRWIGFDQAEAALVRLDALLAYPPRDRMPCLLIYGDTGMGKTKIIRKFERAHPATFCQSTGVTNRPVVVAQVPSEPVERDLYRELLASLQAPALVGGTLAREKDICRSVLRTVGARMIVLDEVNGMLAGTYRQQRIFLNALRFLANDLRVPLVCAGTDLARQALLTDAQLAERFEAFHLKPWKNDHAFARLLKSLAGILPLREPSDLDSDTVRQRIHMLTSGVTARVFRLIETAAEAA
ncbi:MAG: transposase, partial [Rhizobiales bacterium 32-66-8]